MGKVDLVLKAERNRKRKPGKENGFNGGKLMSHHFKIQYFPAPKMKYFLPPNFLKVAIVSYDAEDYKPNFDKKVSTPFAPLSKFFAILSELGEAFVLLSFAPPWAI